VTDTPQVVIVGGGFAGLNAAKELRSADVDITIVDRRNFHLFQPLLYQVASAALNPSDIAYPIRSIFRNQENVRNVVLGEVTAIDVEEGSVGLRDGSSVPFDYLMVATGATHSYFGNDSWASDAPGLKTIEDALDIRGRILRAFEEAERHPEQADEFLTFVIVGAGPTGVEMAGSVAEIAVHALGSDFRHIDPASARVVLVEGSSHVLPVYPESLSSRAQRQLEELGVEVRTDALVVGIDAEGVTLASGERLAARTVVWAAGVQASSLGAALPGDRDPAGRVLVAPDLSLPGHPNVFVAGDLAAVTVDGAPVPGVAPAAMQQGRHVARQVLADLAGAPRSDFRYRDKGSLATIGRARAVADFGRLRFGGPFAWLAWLAIHIVYLIGFRNRVFVVFQWAWQYATFRRGARIITDAVRRGRG
jgi:NADH dehydrogenase